MQANLTEMPQRLFVGMRIQTTLAAQQTLALWQRFKPRVKEISHRADANFYSLQLYDAALSFTEFSSHTAFEKWAAVEVTQVVNLPEGMELLTVPAGTYAVFVHHEPAHTFPQTSQYIFGTWLPQSAYELDQRPHFEVMTPQYQPQDEQAQEEIWVPVRLKARQ
ncbi:MAG: GyrI-like domain-containing protein [Saprospiraceae bacterium]